MKTKAAVVGILIAGALLLGYAWIRERVAVRDGDSAKTLIEAYGVQVPDAAVSFRVAEYQAGPQLCLVAKFVVQSDQVDSAIRSMRPVDRQKAEYESGQIMAARSLNFPAKLKQAASWWTFDPSTQYRIFEIPSSFNATLSVDSTTGVFFLVITD
jgi:hypothetical protein